MEKCAILADEKFDGRKQTRSAGVMTQGRVGCFWAFSLLIPAFYLAAMMYGISTEGGVKTGACFPVSCKPMGDNLTSHLNMTVDVYPTGTKAPGGLRLQQNITYESQGLLHPGEGPFGTQEEAEEACSLLINQSQPFTCAYYPFHLLLPAVAFPAKAQVKGSLSYTAMLGALAFLGLIVCVDALWWSLPIPSLDALTGSEEQARPMELLACPPTSEQLEDPKEHLWYTVSSTGPLFAVVSIPIFAVLTFDLPGMVPFVVIAWLVVRSMPMPGLRNMCPGILKIGKLGMCMQTCEWAGTSSRGRSWLTLHRMVRAARNWKAPEGDAPEGHKEKPSLPMQEFLPPVSNLLYHKLKSYPMWLRAKAQEGVAEEMGAQEALEFEMEHTYATSPASLALKERISVGAGVLLFLLSVVAIPTSLTRHSDEFLVIDRMRDQKQSRETAVWVLGPEELKALAKLPDQMDLLAAPAPIRDGDGGELEESALKWMEKWAFLKKVQCERPWGAGWCGKDHQGLIIYYTDLVSVGICILIGMMSIASHVRSLREIGRLPPRPNRAERRAFANSRPGDPFKEISFVTQGAMLNTSFLQFIPIVVILFALPGGVFNSTLLMAILFWVGMSAMPHILHVYTADSKGVTHRKVKIGGLPVGGSKSESFEWSEFAGMERNWYYATRWHARGMKGESLMEVGDNAVVFFLAAARAAGAREFYAPEGTEPIPDLAAPSEPAGHRYESIPAPSADNWGNVNAQPDGGYGHRGHSGEPSLEAYDTNWNGGDTEL